MVRNNDLRGVLIGVGPMNRYGYLHYQCLDCKTAYPLIGSKIMCNGQSISRCPYCKPKEEEMMFIVYVDAQARAKRHRKVGHPEDLMTEHKAGVFQPFVGNKLACEDRIKELMEDYVLHADEIMVHRLMDSRAKHFTSKPVTKIHVEILD